MRWEFASWVPLVARMCPSDTYKVWKSGSRVRIDTTLLGFDNMSWRRGNRSYVFKGADNEAVFMEWDHENHQIFSETITIPTVHAADPFVLPSEDAVAARLTSPIVTTYVDTEKITFERSKSGFWGWRNDKSEIVNGYDCKVRVSLPGPRYLAQCMFQILPIKLQELSVARIPLGSSRHGLCIGSQFLMLRLKINGLFSAVNVVVSVQISP